MSLGRWLKMYLYIPLGGNRRIGFGTYFWWTVIALVSAALTGWWLPIILPFALFMAGVFVWDRWIKTSLENKKLLYSNLNSFITQVLGGLWHGASWNFIIWGGINGIGMIVEKIWRKMNWHIRFASMTVLTFCLCLADYLTNLPVWRLFAVWAAILWVGTAIRYIYFLCEGTENKFTQAMGTVWAVLQTAFSLPHSHQKAVSE